MAVTVHTHMKSLTATFALSIVNGCLPSGRYTLGIDEELENARVE